MEKYRDDLSQERKPAGLIPEGNRVLKVVSMVKGVSKKGNNQFIVTLEDIKTKKCIDVYMVSEPKKRWMLKSLLNAVGCDGGKDGIYLWSEDDVVGKTINGIIEHYEEPWINSDAVEILSKKCRVTDLYKYESEENKQENGWSE